MTSVCRHGATILRCEFTASCTIYKSLTLPCSAVSIMKKSRIGMGFYPCTNGSEALAIDEITAHAFLVR